MPIAAGSMKPAHPNSCRLVQMLAIMLLFPLQAPTLLPLGIEMGLVHLGWSSALPIFLVLNVVECACRHRHYCCELGGRPSGLAGEKILECVTNRQP